MFDRALIEMCVVCLPYRLGAGQTAKQRNGGVGQIIEREKERRDDMAAPR